VSEINAITFIAYFHKATTTVDGGWNVTFSVSQDEVERISMLSACRDITLQVACVPFTERRFEIESQNLI
jgi:hypothetical protein